jgi:hypothetical protein
MRGSGGYKKGSDHLSEELAWMDGASNCHCSKILIPARTVVLNLSKYLTLTAQAFLAFVRLCNGTYQ